MTVDSNKEGKLTTSIIALKPQEADSFIVWLDYLPNHKTIYIKADTVLKRATQIISNEQYKEFYKIIRGSYYWALEQPYPNGSGYLDGDGLILETKSRVSSGDTLSFHYVSIHVPFEGSFRNACLYLSKVSTLPEAQLASKSIDKSRL